MGVSFAGTKLHEIFVERNKYVEDEYNNYIRVNSQNGKRHRGMEWLFLMRVNLAYFILNRRSKSSSVNGNYHVQMETKLPYMDGAESDILKRPEAFHFARTLLEYDVISFDIFDTLIFRPFRHPTDLFPIIGKRLDFTGFNESFSNIRRRAEREAREYEKVLHGTAEVDIFRIYDIIGKYTNVVPAKGIETEVQAELDYCYANPYMLRVFKILRSQGKKIVITSDMYLPSEYITKLLEKNGYIGYEKLYMSCDYGVSKSTGELYDVILQDNPDTPPEKIIHVGDNSYSDIKMSRKKGLSAYHYCNVNEAGNKYRADGMSSIIGSFYGGIVNAHLYNGIKKYSFYYEYGYTYMGIHAYGMCKWIHDKAVKENVDKIVFLARDGYLYKKVFDRLFDDFETDYQFWSRSAAMRYSVCKRNYEEFVKRYIDYRVNDSDDNGVFITVMDMLVSLDIKELCKELYRYDLQPNDVISTRNKNSLRSFLWVNKEYIIKKYEECYNYLYSDIEAMIADSKRIVMVDVGWTGHNVIHLKKIIQEDMNIDCDIKVWMTTEKSCTNSVDLLDGTIDAYMFTSIVNNNIPQTFHNSKNGRYNTPFFEYGLQPKHSSFVSVNNKGEYIFDIPIVEDYEISNEIEKGIIDFCKEYDEKSQFDVYLRNIPGKEAYMPFAFAVSDFRFIKNNFSYSHMATNIGSRVGTQQTESLKEQFETIKLKNGGKR